VFFGINISGTLILLWGKTLSAIIVWALLRHILPALVADLRSDASQSPYPGRQNFLIAAWRLPYSRDVRLVQFPGWLLNKSCKMLRILLFLCGCCLKTEVFKQLYYILKEIFKEAYMLTNLINTLKQTIRIFTQNDFRKKSKPSPYY
jgi:hypothetical protein